MSNQEFDTSTQPCSEPGVRGSVGIFGLVITSLSPFAYLPCGTPLQFNPLSRIGSQAGCFYAVYRAGFILIRQVATDPD